MDGGDAPCPDVLGFTPGDYTLGLPASAVLPVVEVTSPGNRSNHMCPGPRDNDTVTKMARYARAGIPHYQVVDPDRVSVYALEAGAYREVTAGPSVSVTVPFPVEVSLTT